MRVLNGNQFLVRIFLGESDRFHHTPLSSVGALAVLIGAASAAVLLPARRAARMNPSQLLKLGCGPLLRGIAVTTLLRPPPSGDILQFPRGVRRGEAPR
jgi:hypothetical protein